MAAPSAMGAFFGKETFEIIAMLVSVALVGLLVSNSKGAVQIIGATGDMFSGLMRTATFQ